MSFRYSWYKKFLHTWKIKEVVFVTICFYVMMLSDMNLDKLYSNFTIYEMQFTNKAFTLNIKNRVYDYPFDKGNWQVTPFSD